MLSRPFGLFGNRRLRIVCFLFFRSTWSRTTSGMRSRQFSRGKTFITWVRILVILRSGNCILRLLRTMFMSFLLQQATYRLYKQNSVFRVSASEYCKNKWQQRQLTAIEVMEDLEKSLSASLNLRFRLSALLLVPRLVVKYRSHPLIILPYSWVSSK